MPEVFSMFYTVSELFKFDLFDSIRRVFNASCSVRLLSSADESKGVWIAPAAPLPSARGGGLRAHLLPRGARGGAGEDAQRAPVRAGEPRKEDTGSL